MSLGNLLPFAKRQALTMARWRASKSTVADLHQERLRRMLPQSVRMEGLETRTLFAIDTTTVFTTETPNVDTLIAQIEAANIDNSVPPDGDSADAGDEPVDLGDDGWRTLSSSPQQQLLDIPLFDVDTNDDGIADRFLTGVSLQYGVQVLVTANGSANLLFAEVGSGSSFLVIDMEGNASMVAPTLPESDSPAGALPSRSAHVEFSTPPGGIEVEPGETASIAEFEYDSDPTIDVTPPLDPIPAGFSYTDLSKLLSFSTFDGGVTDILQFTFSSDGFATNSFGTNPNSDNDVTTRAVGRGFVTVSYEYEDIVRDASITIGPDATNEVGDPHTFTAHVEFDDGLGILPADVAAFYDADDVDGFADAVGQEVDVTLTNSNGAVADPAGPFNGLTDANGDFEVTFTSATAGQVTGHASADNVGGFADLDVETDGLGLNSDDAVKTFVDAYITIGPDATNPVGAPHTFTTTVFKDDGLAAGQGGDGVTGFAAAAVGNVDVTLTDTNGAVSIFDAAASTSDDNQPNGDNLDANGQATTTFTSNSVGTVTGHATVTLVVGGVTLIRETDGTSPNSDDAVKVFVNPQIVLKKFANGEDTDCVDVGVGDTVHYTYTVTNGDGAGPAIDFDSLVDDNATPGNTADDFNPIYDSGDDGDGLIEDGETWLFHFDVTAIAGEHENTAVVNGHAVIDEVNVPVTDTDEACYETVGEAGGTATMGFWANKNGQKVIKSDANIGNDLASAYPNLFGTGAATFNLNGSVRFMNLTGQSADNVAAYFKKLKDATGPKPYAQLMANVLAAHFNLEVTSEAEKFGFGDGDLLDDAITLTSAQATALGLPVNTTVGDYLNRVNTIMLGKNGIIPSNLFIVINDVSDMINNMNHV